MKIKIEVQNDCKENIYVQLCKSKASGELYLHVADKPSQHINKEVRGNNYLQVFSEEVED